MLACSIDKHTVASWLLKVEADGIKNGPSEIEQKKAFGAITEHSLCQLFDMFLIFHPKQIQHDMLTNILSCFLFSVICFVVFLL